MIASGPYRAQAEFLQRLGPRELRGLPWLFEFWALPHQLPPPGDWRTWLILGGRGAGKTRAGAEWVRAMVEGAGPRDPGRSRRMALVGETLAQTREVMVFGESGILACSPPDRRPVWQAGRLRLEWPNGAEAQLYSAHDPESLRGPQFDAVWADELAKWKRGTEAWDMIQFGLRLGNDPRACVTTTPRNAVALKDLIAQPGTVTTHAATSANRAWLADAFLEEVQRRYGGTRQGRQELEGLMLPDVEGALWSGAMIARSQTDLAPELTRIVVAVDPAVSAHRHSDACGIIVAGVQAEGPPCDWIGWVIEDATVQGASPLGWAKAAVDALRRHRADRLVAEVNQGGALVETLVRQIDPQVPFRALRATRGKGTRAEPVAALYEQGRVRHLRGLGAVEDQLGQMTAQGYGGSGSPDRADALVWALTELMLMPQAGDPRMRMI